MPLPNISMPHHTIILPSNKKKVSVRQMTIREEKILLVAKESEEEIDKQNAIIQVVKNCIMEDGFDLDNITMLDLEYLFLKIRALSVSNVVQLSLSELDEEGNLVKEHAFRVDLNEVEVKTPENEVSDTIQIDDIVIKLKSPNLAMYSSQEYLSATTEPEIISVVTKHSIASVFEGDKAYTFTLQEAGEFVDQLPASAFEKITEFYAGQPSLSYELKYTDRNGKEQVQTLNTLSDFFIF